ncbi:sodium:proton antiporter [Gordonia sinesedis]
MERILIVVGAVLLIATVTDIAPRFRIPPPLALVVIGAVIGVMPFVAEIHLDPEWILVGVLPPLLYATAVQMPAMDFRRDFGAISALSVLLVLISSVLLGVFFMLVIPGIGLAAGIALGAIVSPTDAVATSIAKRMGVPARVTAVLEGESMLNDATALVLLRGAVAAMASTISFAGLAFDFAYAVVAAVAIGVVVGVLNLRIRSRITNAAANTAISFTVPYLAYLPAEELGASGLVAAVTAGLITGAGAARWLTPQHRSSDAQNWQTVALIAEGGVFLLMGLELWGLMIDVHRDHSGVWRAVWIGLAALLVTILIRAVYVVPLTRWLDARRKRGNELRPILEGFTVTPNDDGTVQISPIRRRRARWKWRFGLRRRPQDITQMPAMSPETADRINSRITRTLADIDYYTAAPLGPKEAVIVVWAGLRGVVTVAAAQTLPADTHARSLLVLIAFVVAAASLLLQGGTLPWLIRRLRLVDTSDDITAERLRLRAELDRTAQDVMATSEDVNRIPWLRPRVEQVNRDADEADDADEVPGATTPYGMSPEDRAKIRAVRRQIIEAQRRELLKFRREGVYSSAVLSRALRQLDAEEISLDSQST